ncbi:MAG: hypothetical protein ACSLFF_09905 [Solirubrobacterales bacterium]
MVVAIALVGCGSGDGETQTVLTADDGAPLCPKGVSADNSFDARALVGLMLVKARAEAARYGCEVRPVSVDGRKLANVQDARDDHINVALERARIERTVGVC